MDPITSPPEFEHDPAMSVTEQSDGSAVFDTPPDEEAAPAGHFDNLAESLDTFTLNSAATTLLELIERDKEARKKRDEQYEEGLKRTGLGDDAPGGAMFAGASRAVHPIMAEGCVDFAARAIKELVPANGPVKTKIWGQQDKEKLDRAKRKRDYLNWLLTKKMRSYRDEKEILLTQLPLGGSQYEKYYVEGEEGAYRYQMEFVPVDRVLLPFSASSFYSTPRATHLLDLTRAEFERRINSGFYRDIDNLLTDGIPEETAAEKANDKIEGREANNYNEDGLRRVYEVRCDWDFNDEGLAPYVISIDGPSEKIIAVYRNWAEDDTSREALDWWVEDKFIPWRGVYGIGLPHLIGGLAASLTGALRALLDSAHINNSPGAVKLKGGRASGQNLTIEQTQVVELEAPPGVTDIRQIIMPLPFNQPSPVLFQLLDWITAQAKGVVSTAEERIADASNQMPVGTALALIEQGSQVFSSIHARLHEAQRRGLEILCRLIRDYPNIEDLAKFGLSPQDFADGDDIEPVSDPRIFSESQRFAQLQEQIKLMQAFPQLPWKFDEVARRGLELLRIEGVDNLLPPTPQPVTADPVTENVAAVAGVPVAAVPPQDHMAHAVTHLQFIIAGPHSLTQGPMPQLGALLNHVVNEHLILHYRLTTEMVGQQLAQQAMMSGQQPSGDQVAAEAAMVAQQTLAPDMQKLAPLVQQASQIVAQRTPQPPIDPAVQKTFEATMADIQRKAQESQANLQFEMQKFQATNAMEQQQQQFDATMEQQKLALDTRIAEMGNVLKLQIAQMQEEGKRAAEELRAQITMMKNGQDNEQKQMTELLKNLQDNETQLQIALQKVSSDVEQLAASGPDFTPQVDQLNQVLSTVQQTRGQDALTTVVQGLQAVIESMNRPKMIVEDEAGRPIGIR